MSTLPAPVVRVISWDHQHAVAVVDGTLVRVRRNSRGAQWKCTLCGTEPQPFCRHTRALADTTPPSTPDTPTEAPPRPHSDAVGTPGPPRTPQRPPAHRGAQGSTTPTRTTQPGGPKMPTDQTPTTPTAVQP